jgi:MFS family permease
VLVTLLLAYLIGGYTAGRMASRKGPRHGLLMALLGVLATTLFMVIGAAEGFGLSDNLSGVVLPDLPAGDEQQGLGSL